MKYRELLNQLLTLSEEQLELETLVFVRKDDNFVRPNSSLFYVTEFDEFEEELVTNQPYISV
tara:strand:+ start:598 stop:783 length:186 start_codon:yes stop_codon:yes gene_type:complete